MLIVKFDAAASLRVTYLFSRSRNRGPQAPAHILIIPSKHFASWNEATSEDQAVIGKMRLVAAELTHAEAAGWIPHRGK